MNSSGKLHDILSRPKGIKQAGENNGRPSVRHVRKRGGGKPMNQKLEGFFFDPDKIAEAMLCGHFFDPMSDEPPSHEYGKKCRYTLTSWRGDFYQWAAGCWTRVSDSEIDLLITKHLQDHNSGPSVSLQQEPVIPIRKDRIANIRLCLAARVLRPETKTLNQWDNITQDTTITLSMKNGLLVLRQDGPAELIPHTPDYFSLIQLPYGYDPAAQCPLWEGFVNDVMFARQEYILLVQQWCGYLLRPDLRQQKFLLCVGEGANGKGVFFEIIQNLVGVENCSQVPVARFNSPFALHTTLGKMVNLTHESSGFIEEEAETTLKSYTSGDRMTFERKFRDPVSDVPTAKIMISTNDLPRFNDRSQAIWRRILLVPFDLVVAEDKQIDTLADDLKKELPGILNWALEGLRNLNKAGRFTVPKNSQIMLEQYRQDANPARAFLLENYTSTDNGEYVGCEVIYTEYKNWCDRCGHCPLGDKMFGKEVRRVFPNVKNRRPGSGNTRGRVYEGITSNTSNETLI